MAKGLGDGKYTPADQKIPGSLPSRPICFHALLHIRVTRLGEFLAHWAIAYIGIFQNHIFCFTFIATFPQNSCKPSNLYNIRAGLHIG
jgi:hypothetical protein